MSLVPAFDISIGNAWMFMGFLLCHYWFDYFIYRISEG